MKDLNEKRIEVDGVFYQKRRNKLVKIPERWVGQTVHPQTIRKRPSEKVKVESLEKLIDFLFKNG